MKETAKITSENNVGGSNRRRITEQAQARIFVLMLISFLLGIGVTIAWFRFSSKTAVQDANQQNTPSQTSNESTAMQAVQHAASTNRPYTPTHPPVNTAAIDEVKRIVPNLASVSLADGVQMLQNASLKEFQQSAKDTESELKQAEQRVTQLQTSGSANELEAARKHLQQVQSQGAEKLQQIAAQLQTDIAALKQLKGTAQ